MITIAKANENQLINDSIKFAQVRLIDADGTMIGVVSIEEARKRAEEAELDLVCISPNPENPVCRIMDYKKFLFEKGKKEKEAKKKQKETELKEIGLKLTTDVHDTQGWGKTETELLRPYFRILHWAEIAGTQLPCQS